MEEKTRVGLGIGIISRGYVPLRWATQLRTLSQCIPGGMFWDYVMVEGKSWAEGRTEVVRKARERNFEWLFFLDDDVLIPDDTIRRLLSHGKKIVNGIYYTKAEPSVPVIFKEFGAGPYMDWKPGDFFEITGAGLGCTLIHMSVFDDFEKAGIPFFKENWTYHDEKFGNIKCPVGEDHYFFIHAKKLGHKIYCDANVMCDHWDLKSQRSFPPEEVVREITARKLESMGRNDLVLENKIKLAEDPEKKTVVILNHVKAAFSGDEDKKRGIGGSEGDIIFLAREFHKKGYNVHVFCNCPSPGVYEGVRYHDITKGFDYVKTLAPDFCIVSRNCNIITANDLKNDFNCKHVNLWLHDMPDSPAHVEYVDASNKADSVVALSQFHKKKMLEYFPDADPTKIVVIGNGVASEYFDGASDRDPHKLLYTSTPHRGLDILLEVFPKIKELVPQTTLDVYSSMKVYGDAFAQEDDEFQHLFDKAKKMEGVNYFGTVKKEVLGKAMRDAGVLAYPCNFPETLCVTALEAQRAGLPIITSTAGALPETCDPSRCKLIPGLVYTPEFKETFVKEVVKELLHRKIGWADKPKLKDNTWASKAVDWESNVFEGGISSNGQGVMAQIQKKIIFLNYNTCKFTGDTPEKSTLGGAELSLVYLAREFSLLGYETHVFCNCSEPGEFSGVQYHHMNEHGIISEISPDLCIVSRNTDMIAKNDLQSVCKKVVLWAHDLPNGKPNVFLKEAYEKVDLVITVSDFLRGELVNAFDIQDSSKLKFIHNGVNTKLFNKEKSPRDPYALLYCSIPFKGLEKLLRIFPEIKKRVPNATLVIRSDMGLYTASHSDQDDSYKKLYSDAQSMEGVKWKRAVPQEDLAHIMSEVSILAYPNIYRETCCNVALEAQQMGLPIISTFQGSLPEVCNPESTILIQPGKEYDQNFIDATCALLQNQERLESLRDKNKDIDFSWKNRAEQWQRICFPEDTAVEVNSKSYWDTVYEHEYQRGKNREEVERFEKILSFCKGDTIIDVGCGTGELTSYLKDALPAPEIWGSDISEVALELARAKTKKVFYENQPIESPDEYEDYFDTVICSHTLEHLQDPSILLEKFKRILKPKGIVIIVLPLNDEPYHEHFHIFDKESAVSLIDAAGFTVKSVDIRDRGLFYKDGREMQEILIVGEWNG